MSKSTVGKGHTVAGSSTKEQDLLMWRPPGVSQDLTLGVMPISLVKQQVNVLKMTLLESYITSALSQGEKLDAKAYILAWTHVWISGTSTWDHLKDHADLGLLTQRTWTYVTFSKQVLASLGKEERYLLAKGKGWDSCSPSHVWISWLTPNMRA